jgi:hypothetical protein
MSPENPAARISSIARSTTARSVGSPSFIATTTSVAPTATAATSAPSSTSQGLARSRARSL